MENEENFSKSFYRQKLETFYKKSAVRKMADYNQIRPILVLQKIFTITLIISIILLFINVKFFFLTIISILFLLVLIQKKTDICGQNSSIEVYLKESLMPKFLSIFGDFTWSNVTENNILKYSDLLQKLKIFPKTTFLAFDDMIKGKFKNVDLEIVEIRTGFYAPALLNFIILIFVYMGMQVLNAIVIFILLILINLLPKNTPELIKMIIILLPFLYYLLIWPICIIRNAITKQSVKGVLIKYTFPKKFENSTFIFENKFLTKKLVHKGWDGYQKVVLENPEFNKKYTVLSQDQVEARYLLTTSFIERFDNLLVAFNAQYQRLEFKDDSLYILVGTKKNLFEMNSLIKDSDFSTFKNLFEELYSILSIIEQLKLDQKIGL